MVCYFRLLLSFIVLIGVKLLRSAEAVRLSDLLTLYRAVLKIEPLAIFLDGYSPDTDSDISGVKALRSLGAGLRDCAQKCEKFLALVEDVVDDQRVRETYGARAQTGLDVSSADAAVEIQWAEAMGSGMTEVFRDKWVRVRPTFRPRLQELYGSLQNVQDEMRAELARVTAVCGGGSGGSAITAAAAAAVASTTSTGKRSRAGTLKTSSDERAPARIVMLETSDVHGPHFRVTKKHATQVLKALSAGAGGGSGKGADINKAFLKPLAGNDVKSSAAAGTTVLSVQRAGTLFMTPPVCIDLTSC
jgi:hypothetical protein